MQRKLTVTIDANQVTCGACEWLEGLSANELRAGYCLLFSGYVGRAHGRRPLRLDVCVAAEFDCDAEGAEAVKRLGIDVQDWAASVRAMCKTGRVK